MRLSLAKGDPGFGRSVLCWCVGMPAAKPVFDPDRHGIPPALATATLANWHPGNARPRLASQSYALGEWPPEKPQLVLFGPPGRGKSHLGAAIVRAVWEKHGVVGAFIEVPELMDRLRATFSDDASETTEGVMGWLERVPLLVLDDLGQDKQTEFVSGRVFRMVNHRYSHRLPTVITLNQRQFDGLDMPVQSRLRDRTAGELVEVTGTDRRTMP